MMLFVFDIDNTLIIHSDGEAILKESVKDAIRLIFDNGHKAIFATGRTLHETVPLMDILHINDAVVFDGAVLVENGKIIYEKFIDKSISRDFLIKSRENELAVLAVNLDGAYVHYNNKVDDVIEIVKTYSQSLREENSFLEIDEDKEYYSLSCFEKYPYERFENANYKDWPIGISISPKDVSKVTGIKEYINRHNIDRDCVYVFGDNYNDVEMFDEFFENSYVSCAADDGVKTRAKNVLAPLEHDGILMAVKEILGEEN